MVFWEPVGAVKYGYRFLLHGLETTLTSLKELAKLIVRRRDRRMASEYLFSHKVAKLHIGCGHHPIDGWLNTDRDRYRGAMRLNADKKFPFADGIFDYLYSEHMIEHVSFGGGRTMLSECFRVIKSGGGIRIATPDLRFLISLYKNDDPLTRRYVDWAARQFLDQEMPHSVTSVINNFVRAWGNTFIYDLETLHQAMEVAGLVKVKQQQVRISSALHLMKLENQGRVPTEYYNLETIILEGMKV
jgi:predicted SAM-dependent methyltransferase